MSTESIKVSSMEDRADKLRQRKAPLNTTRPSRDKDPTEEIIGQENIGTPPSSETIKINTSTLDHRSEIAQLWLQSRLEYAPEEDGPSYRRKGEYRPLTRENIRISVRLFRLLFKPFVQLFWEGNEWKIMGYVFGRLVKGIFPAGRSWAQAQMLDVVQKSLKRGQVDTRKALRKAVLSIFLNASEDMYNYLARSNERSVDALIDRIVKRSFLSAQLSLSIPARSSPFIAALQHEAGVLIGLERRIDRKGVSSYSSTSTALRHIFEIGTITIDMISQATLLLRTIFSVKTANFSWSTIILVILSFAPSLFRLCGGWILRVKRDKSRRTRSIASYKALQELPNMGRKRYYAQEVVLFGLKDWIIEKWDDATAERAADLEEMRERNGLKRLGIEIGHKSIQTAFYVLLALRLLTTKLTLGSIKLYQSTANHLFQSVQTFTYTLEKAFQTVFFLAAYMEMISDPESRELLSRTSSLPPDGKLIDYDSVRGNNGMTIQAISLGLTYPGSTKPVLHGINLTIPAGQTLAIVGFNGSGKTTLVEALMGLYHHTAELFVNGRPIEEYNPQSLHKRTSCLFQDFCQYSFTLRNNVGMGNVNAMEDTEKILLAIQRADAEKVRDKVGLEGLLDQYGVPEVGEEVSVPVGRDKAKKQGNEATKSQVEAKEQESHPKDDGVDKISEKATTNADNDSVAKSKKVKTGKNTKATLKSVDSAKKTKKKGFKRGSSVIRRFEVV